jgi:branched-chain amino acid transport system permease protein
MSGLSLFVQQSINGLTLGAMYALLALGFTMVYGIMELINFAHFSVFMVGTFVALYTFEALGIFGQSTILHGLPLIGVLLAAFIVTMAVCGGIGMGIERFFLRRLRAVKGPASMITTIGISYILSNSVLLFIGGQGFNFPNPIPPVKFHFGQAVMQVEQPLIWVVSAVLMLGLTYFVHSTKLGKAMRATAQDQEAARMMGVDVDRVILSSFFLGSALAGAAAVIFGLYYEYTNFYIGFDAGLRAFTAAVLGGIGNVPGAMLGGLLIGIIETMTSQFISTNWAEVVIFSILVIVLVFRPAGLLGRVAPNKS